MNKYTLKKTNTFLKWFDCIRDIKAKRIIIERLIRIELGNFGETKYLENDLYELKFRYGNAYRIYYYIENKEVVLLISGGDKTSQKRDIQKALAIKTQLENQK